MPSTKKSKQQQKQRVRVTNKALEARQFSTVRLPKHSEVQVPNVDVDKMFEERNNEKINNNNNSDNDQEPAISNSNYISTGNSTPAAFDPIPNDNLFIIISKSKYWPPPSLEELQRNSENPINDGFDNYDRREDDLRARKEKTKIVRGEINHPRGKPRQNTIVKLDDSDKE